MLASSDSPRHNVQEPAACLPSAQRWEILWKCQLRDSCREVSLLLIATVIYSLLLALRENTSYKPSSRAVAVNMCGMDRWAVGITLKPRAGGWLWLLPVKEGSRSRERLLPWHF